MSDLDPPLKPIFRGVLHQYASGAALGAGAVLVTVAPTARAALAAGIYASSLFVLFVVSAVYHRVNWGPVARARMRRADHASIFILIAGTYTPIALLGLPEGAGGQMSLLVWTGALLGVLQSLFWVNAPKPVTAILAVAVGWAIVPWFHEVAAALQPAELVPIVLGGIAYTVGAVAYATKRPNFRAGVFGYHETFHALTIVAAVLHFAAVLHLVQRQGA